MIPMRIKNKLNQHSPKYLYGPASHMFVNIFQRRMSCFVEGNVDIYVVI